ncbi:hypothetical protein PVBG_06306, partial [Plasmodium vivax Brazil I]
MAEAVLKELPSEVFYKALNDNGNDNGDGNKCSMACESIETGLEQEKIKQICTKLEKKVCYVKNYHKDKSSFFQKHCYDLNYWLYKEVTKELGENDKNIYPIFEKIQNQW